MKEIDFNKYKTHGHGYHWDQFSNDIRKRNLFVVGLYELIIEKIGNIEGKRVLDVGCGDGVLAHEIAKQGGREVVGLDSSKEAIAFANKKTKLVDSVSYICGNAYQIPFETNSFDIVVSSELIEHLQQPKLLLKEMHRVWNGVGSIVISTPNKLTRNPRDPNHVQEYFENELRQLLEQEFKTVKIHLSHPVFWHECLTKKIAQKPIPKILFNLLNKTTGFNPFKQQLGWNYWAQQIAEVNN